MQQIDALTLHRLLGKHLAVYRFKTPTYQKVMLNSLLRIWQHRHDRLLDIGSGTGVIAEAMAELFPVGSVHAVDLTDRFCTTLNIPTQRFNGIDLPFESGAFDAATLLNVMHHVPVEARTDLLLESRRVVDGPLYIKDHVTRGVLDDIRLTAMDAIGNIPFGGMVWARYLSGREWEDLAASAGYRIEASVLAQYRSAPYSWVFPNRLEAVFRFEPL